MAPGLIMFRGVDNRTPLFYLLALCDSSWHVLIEAPTNVANLITMIC